MVDVEGEDKQKAQEVKDTLARGRALIPQSLSHSSDRAFATDQGFPSTYPEVSVK